MKIDIAPDSFKGSLSVGDAADAIDRGLKRGWPDVETVKIPITGGGEGTM